MAHRTCISCRQRHCCSNTWCMLQLLLAQSRMLLCRGCCSSCDPVGRGCRRPAWLQQGQKRMDAAKPGRCHSEKIVAEEVPQLSSSRSSSSRPSSHQELGMAASGWWCTLPVCAVPPRRDSSRGARCCVNGKFSIPGKPEIILLPPELPREVTEKSAVPEVLHAANTLYIAPCGLSPPSLAPLGNSAHF